jgi:glycosyltransferase involved in cell wall biosynthesis
METEGIPESQLVVIPNGIPLEVSSERERRARRREVRAEIWGGGASDVGSDVRGEGAGDAAGDVRSDVGGEGAGGGAGDVGSDVRGEGAGDAVGDVRSDVGSGERRAGDRKVVGITAVLRPEKNHELLMAAFARVRRETDAELWIVGDGPRRPDLEELARSLGISGSVRFLGLRPDARRIMYGFDVAVLSSHPLVETLPLALMEAMDAGVPLVATRVGALAEMIEDGRSGLLVDPGDEEGLARALRSVLLDSERAARFSRAGSEIVRRRFSVDQMVTQTENLIQTLLSARRS